MSLFLDIEKDLGSFHLRVKLDAENETLALLGGSGCGKSMTLRCIAGIVRPDRGRIEVDGVTLFDSEKGVDLSPQTRRTGLLFQNYALFPNMTVRQNILCGARRERDGGKREKKVNELMESFGLLPLAGRLPSQLSGGQQQRAALARILVSDPRILLLDEPFSALDAHLRFRLEQEVRGVIRDFGKTVVLVSHDRDEVYRLSDRIALMENGQIDAVGTRHQIFAAPGTAMGAALTGCKNISPVTPLADGRARAEDWGIDLALPAGVAVPGSLGIRMHDICPGPGPNGFRCRVAEELENPFSVTVFLVPEGAEGAVPLGWELDKAAWAALRGDRVEVHLPPEKLLILQ